MDRIERPSRSAEVADDTFQESLARLSLHLATRQPMRPLPAPPPRRAVGRAWPYALLVTLVGVAAAGYPHYEALLHGYLPRFVTPRIAAVSAAPTPVLASIALAPEPALPPPASRPSRNEPVASVDVAAALPPPPPPEPPVTLPTPVSAAAPQPEIALSWSEILEVQKRLLALGINPGPIDGVVGARTTGGVQRYEERLGHDVTGKVDRSLLTLLRRDPATSAMVPARAP